ncbi:hypothetical protein [Fuchsiella alkaliacetigena]|uniref:hypothetical protein n=1 Tax=Fuchsiella alkaliacetigena TaxID=957042 RepID=UPI00200A8F98|nr:hypothetical protein [Fuchsiella alkaliacetigena]MCK8825110.1 hypothetical protein [Fuchsiella alkaliacetigena]
MSYKLAVIGIGDLKQQDRGLSIHLLESLKRDFEQESIRFINGGSDGKNLFAILKDIAAEKIMVLETAANNFEAGKLNYLLINFEQSANFAELVLVTIEVAEIDWGSNLSSVMKAEYKEVLNSIKTVVDELLSNSFSNHH